AARILDVTADQRELVRLHLVRIELEVELHAAVDQLGELGADPRVRQGDADLDFLRVRSRDAEGERGDGDRDDALHHEQVPPEGATLAEILGQESETVPADRSARRKVRSVR